ncbi:hypothetical protein BKA69DRAFT_1069459 [Paraphysoderma sedebokerense]|nr:hypothetical protein BKA69DRAFT_1069459 [Paraphysoderma sedebokerense]
MPTDKIVNLEEVAPLLRYLDNVPSYSTVPCTPILVDEDRDITSSPIHNYAVNIENSTGIEVVAEDTPLPPPSSKRVLAIDHLRGLIMMFMSLDHARKYITSIDLGGEESFDNSPTYNDNLWHFFARFVTHLSAPGFFFLMGLGAVYFYHSRKRLNMSGEGNEMWSDWRIVRHFWIRGFILVALSLTFFNDGIMFKKVNPSDKDLDGVRLSLGVLYSLGSNMIIAIVIVALGFRLSTLMSSASLLDSTVTKRRIEIYFGTILLLVSIAIPLITEYVVFHVVKSRPPSDVTEERSINPLLLLFFIPSTSGILQVVYPIFPWLSPTLWGVSFGLLFKTTRPVKSAFNNLMISVILITSFLFIRFGYLFKFGNIYDHLHDAISSVDTPSPTRMTPLPITWPPSFPTFIKFFTITKYPPSLAFLTITIGLNHLFLCILYLLGIAPSIASSSSTYITTPTFSNRLSTILTNTILTPLLIFGQSSLFFYIFHVLLYFVMGIIIKRFIVPGGTDLLGLMPWWIGGLIVLGWMCKFYGGFKHRTPKDSIWRFF